MFICLVMAVATMLPVTAFAEENTQSEENSYCYFIDGVQVEQDEYHQYTQGYVQMKQADKPASPALELENTFDYYIVNADGIKKVTEMSTILHSPVCHKLLPVLLEVGILKTV